MRPNWPRARAPTAANLAHDDSQLNSTRLVTSRPRGLATPKIHDRLRSCKSERERAHNQSSSCRQTRCKWARASIEIRVCLRDLLRASSSTFYKFLRSQASASRHRRSARARALACLLNASGGRNLQLNALRADERQDCAHALVSARFVCRYKTAIRLECMRAKTFSLLFYFFVCCCKFVTQNFLIVCLLAKCFISFLIKKNESQARAHF